MVRPISAAAQTKLDQNLGTEPINIIEVQWVDGGSIYTYADKDLGQGEGKILSVSGLDNTVVIQGVAAGTSGDSQQLSVTLDDSDGSIKEILNTHDVHKEAAWVYQSFQGLDIGDKFLIFKGQISSPMQWNEGDRTVSFDIITRIEDAEVGFSVEEGDFGANADNLVGQSWPLVFGTVKQCQALKTRTPLTGTLKTGFGIRDFVLAPKLEQTRKVCCALVFTGWTVFRQGDKYIINPLYEFDSVCECKRQALICEYQLNIAAQAPFEFNPLEIIGGETFPQGQRITLDIQGANLTGSFTGTEENPTNIFSVTRRTHPKSVSGEISVPKIKSFPCFTQDVLSGSQPPPSQTPGNTSKACTIEGDCSGYNSLQPRQPQFIEVGENHIKSSWDYLASFRLAGFFWADPGSEVTVSDDSEFVYIVNILPSTVHQVKAWKTFSVSNLRQLTTVPNDLYSVRLTDYNGYTVTEIVLTSPLSAKGEGWEDDLFVTHTSTIGPNPVDIMEWLIDKYTDFSWDSTFATVKTTVDNYPMHFMVPGRMNILQLLQEISWQGRMAMVLRNDEFRLTYLPEEPISNGTITENDVLANSLVLDHTDTEDLITKFVAEWRPECNLEKPYKVILRYNVKRYGTHEGVFDFYCYNIRELVLKSATFWLVRMANTWKKIICKTPVNKLALETLDGVFVTLNDIANEEIKCRVETTTYNSADRTIDFVLQTPVRSGEMAAYTFHYPANISIEDIFPFIEDIQFGNSGGSGPNVFVKPPVGHALSNEASGGSVKVGGDKCDSRFLTDADSKDCGKDQGDRKPTDTDDVKPTIPLEDDNSAIPPQQSPVGEITENAYATESDNISSGGDTSDGFQSGTDNTDSGTGSGSGAGSNGGAGKGGGEAGSGDAGSADDAAQDVQDALNEMPTPDELDEENICHFDLILFTAEVTTVRIPVGQSCNGNECEAAIGWCYCTESGKSGAPVGNVIPSDTETIAFSTIEERNIAFDEAQKQVNNTASVGDTIAWFVSSGGSDPPCTDRSGFGDMLGYEKTGGESVVGKDGFLSGPDTSTPVDF